MPSLARRTATGSDSRLGVEWLVVSTLALASVLSLLWGGQLGAAAQQGPQAWQAVMLAHAFGAAALVCIALQRRLERTPLWAVFFLALMLRLLATQAAPLLEDDHHRYLWDGMRTATAMDPYHLPPEAYFGQRDLSTQWQDVLSGINHPDVPTIYGPMLQFLFAGAYLIGPGQTAPLKGLLLCVDLLVLVLLARQRVPVRWLLAYAVHPLLLKEVMGSMHPDGLMALWLLLAALAWRKQQAWRVGVWLACAVATKVAALVLLPLLLLSPNLLHRWGWAGRASVGLGLGLLALYAPFVIAGGDEWAGLSAFGQHWRFNPLLFRVMASSLPEAWVGLVRYGAGAVVLVGVLWMAYFWTVRVQARQPSVFCAPSTMPPWDAALLLLIVMSPVVNPWYWLWGLPLAVLHQRVPTVVMGTVAVVSYTHGAVLGTLTAHWLGDQPFAVAWPITLVQLLALSVALAVQRFSVAAPATTRAARG
jgi:alpha-1,6-mannosyltransferase